MSFFDDEDKEPTTVRPAHTQQQQRPQPRHLGFRGLRDLVDAAVVAFESLLFASLEAAVHEQHDHDQHHHAGRRHDPPAHHHRVMVD